MNSRNKPPWLDEQAGILSLLNTIVDRLNAKPGSRPRITINKKHLPELFVLGEKADLCWSLLQTLFEEPCAVFVFKESNKRNQLDPEYTNATLSFNLKAENLLRLWLGRPLEESPLQKWRNCVEKQEHNFSGETSRLKSSCISVVGKSAEQVVQGFVEIKKYLDKELTLRNLSSRCFWQDSKFLDSREDLIRQLYPQLNIKTRPVMVNIYFPEKIHGVLFIENQDSYLQGIHGLPAALQNMALVYSAGFTASALRIRQADGVALHFHESSHMQFKQMFKGFWYESSDGESSVELPVFFWGDLDFAGMTILSILRKRFPKIEAWQEGYQPMLELLLAGEGHSAESTRKLEQKDSGTTGCQYADEMLLPALRRYELYVDQEWIN